MAKHPGLVVWTDAFIADTHHLSYAEFGAYMRLIITAWRRPGCDLPDDDKFLAARSGGTAKQWSKVRPVVMDFWDKGEDGLFRQKRLTFERQYADKKKNQQSLAGKASALKRQQTHSTGVEPPLQRPNQPPTLPSSKKEEVSVLAISRKKAADEIEAEFLVWYADYPAKVARAAGLKAYRAARGKTDAATLVEGLVLYKQTKPPDQNWKHPATWLNGECWLDDYGPSGKNKPFRM